MAAKSNLQKLGQHLPGTMDQYGVDSAIYCGWVNKTFVTLPKNASNAIGRALRNKGKTTGCNPQTAKGEIVVLWRSPFDRLASWYRYVTQINHRYPENRKAIPKAGWSFEQFIEALVNIPDFERNKHYRSQYTLSFPYHPTKIIRWDFEELKREFELEFIGRENATSNGQEFWTDELATKLLKDPDYQRDWGIWTSTKS